MPAAGSLRSGLKAAVAGPPARAPSAVGDKRQVAPVRRPGRPEIVPAAGRHGPQAGAIGVHHIDIQIVFVGGGQRDLLPIRRPARRAEEAALVQVVQPQYPRDDADRQVKDVQPVALRLLRAAQEVSEALTGRCPVDALVGAGRHIQHGHALAGTRIDQVKRLYVGLRLGRARVTDPIAVVDVHKRDPWLVQRLSQRLGDLAHCPVIPGESKRRPGRGGRRRRVAGRRGNGRRPRCRRRHCQRGSPRRAGRVSRRGGRRRGQAGRGGWRRCRRCTCCQKRHQQAEHPHAQEQSSGQVVSS